MNDVQQKDIAVEVDTDEPSRILVVDDDPRNRRLFEAMLRHKGYEVVLAEHGPAGLEAIDSGGVDAVILDLMMPEMDGLEVVSRLRNRGYSILPVIVVTASGQDERRIQALEAGADDFLTKPVDRVELLTRLRNSLRVKNLHDELQLKAHRLAESESRVRRREKELRASLVDHLPIVLFEGYCPPHDGRIYPELNWVSANAIRVMGVEADKLKGMASWLDFIHEEDRPQVRAEFDRILESERDSWSTEFRWQPPNGEDLWLLGGGGVVERTRDGRARRMMCFALDVTERRHLQDQLQQAAKLEAVGELAAGLAHDFNNMLAVIQSYAEFIEKDGDDQSSEDATEILGATRRARKLTADLLSFSRNQAVDPSAESLSQIVEGLQDMLERLVGNDIELEVDCLDGDPLIVAPVGEVERVIVNLVTNARDAIGEDGGVISIETRLEEIFDDGTYRELEPGSYVVLTVQDDGCGMDEETMERVFEPFFTTKDPGSGTGLGLATVYGIARQAGGDVSVQSEEGVGTTFRLFFPTADSEALESLSEVNLASDTEPMEEPGRVLVLDDAGELRKAVVRKLRLEGLDVVGVGSPVEAVALVRESPDEFGILISDVVMPEMSGFDAAVAIREACPGIRVIFMSGYTGADDAERARELSEQRIVAKPFEFEELLGVVRRTIEGTGY